MKRIMNYAGCVGRYLRDTRAVAAMEYAIIVGVVVGRSDWPGLFQTNHGRMPGRDRRPQGHSGQDYGRSNIAPGRRLTHR